MRMHYFDRSLVALPRLIIAVAFVLSISLTAPVSAGPFEDANAAYIRGDYAAAWAKAKETTWWDLRALARVFGNTLYGELANERLAQIRPDASQSVIGPLRQTGKRTSLWHAKADSTCSYAVSFDSDHNERGVRLWSLPNGQPIATISLPFAISGVAVSQEYLAIQGPHSIRLYDVKAGSFLSSIEDVSKVAVSFSENGKELWLAPGVFISSELNLTAKFGRLFNLVTGAEYPSQTSVSFVNLQASTGSDCVVNKQEIFANLH
jgi:hypothetical protein